MLNPLVSSLGSFSRKAKGKSSKTPRSHTKSSSRGQVGAEGYRSKRDERGMPDPHARPEETDEDPAERALLWLLLVNL